MLGTTKGGVTRGLLVPSLRTRALNTDLDHLLGRTIVSAVSSLATCQFIPAEYIR